MFGVLNPSISRSPEEGRPEGIVQEPALARDQRVLEFDRFLGQQSPGRHQIRYRLVKPRASTWILDAFPCGFESAAERVSIPFYSIRRQDHHLPMHWKTCVS